LDLEGRKTTGKLLLKIQWTDISSFPLCYCFTL
jgi:hypothetical protein